jgi:leucyl/phenylalanyl-tRNA--protein transferase
VAEVVGVGADLEPGTLLAAYRAGLFPMRLERDGPIGWWAPDPRGIIPLDGLHVSRSLRRAVRDVEIRIDTAFAAVVKGCADPSRPHGWIDDAFMDAYSELHRLGWAHSVESWYQGELVGGLYGVAIGGLFAAESKYHVRRDASKVSLVGLVELLRAEGGRLLDVQWTTPHLTSLGAVDVTRDRYQVLLADALASPLPSSFDHAAG